MIFCSSSLEEVLLSYSCLSYSAYVLSNLRISQIRPLYFIQGSSGAILNCLGGKKQALYVSRKNNLVLFLHPRMKMLSRPRQTQLCGICWIGSSVIEKLWHHREMISRNASFSTHILKRWASSRIKRWPSLFSEESTDRMDTFSR